MSLEVQEPKNDKGLTPKEWFEAAGRNVAYRGNGADEVFERWQLFNAWGRGEDPNLFKKIEG